MRPSTGKTTCHIYDLVGNIEELGKAESVRVEKVENKWNVTSETNREGFHYAKLYTFKAKAPTVSPLFS
jgi:hypothetical protein